MDASQRSRLDAVRTELRKHNILVRKQRDGQFCVYRKERNGLRQLDENGVQVKVVTSAGGTTHFERDPHSKWSFSLGELEQFTLLQLVRDPCKAE